MATKLQPLADRVLVKPMEKEEKTKSGIYLPDTAKEKPQEGKVIAVGPGKMSEDGKTDSDGHQSGRYGDLCQIRGHGNQG